MNAVETRQIRFGARIDGTPWTIPVVTVRGSRPGPRTAVVGGIWGDKALGVLAVHRAMERVIADDELAGTVVFVPAANGPALSIARREGPDGHQLNRRFPGAARGAETDQVAFHLLAELTASADLVVDLHSGTPTMELRYTYDFGAIGLSAAFGRLPIVIDHTYPGQMCSALARAGVPAILPEFGGGRVTAVDDGVAGVLNVLRYAGQVGGALDGPATIPVIRDLDLFLVSVHGVFQHESATPSVGSTVEPGILGRVTSVVDDSILEEYVIEREGGILLMASTAPSVATPGQYAFMVGYPHDEVALPARATFAG